MQMVKIKNSVFDCDNGNPFTRFKAGETYEQTPDALRQVALGNAELVDVDPPAAEAAEPASTETAAVGALAASTEASETTAEPAPAAVQAEPAATPEPSAPAAPEAAATQTRARGRQAAA